MRDRKGKHILYQRAQTRLIGEAKESDVLMQNVAIKIVIEYLERELHSQSTENGCTETLLVHLYSHVLTARTNSSRRVA